ncbi:MAG: NAD+ synthase [Xanthomonadaceae bacterium]|nr:NAD+ synthase [Xanthomonadaceae bacterium]MDP2184438.1 NAD+ synthase [Xanthomonadales bacterium]MDZ4116945.1 NAD+ synthase [Xanthomonadaceae bacterium]MDZ4378641.1 NAD+ synthase [Xanthomonadaceae bacterium]
MSKLRVALAQCAFRVGDIAGNARLIADGIAHARDALGAELVLFPELSLCGYPPEDLLLRPSFLVACEAALAELALHTRGIVALVGHPLRADGALFNALSVLRDGRIAASYRKQVLPNYAVFDERRYFVCGDTPQLIDVAGVSIGLLICEDVWQADRVRASAQHGAALLLVANASPFERDKHAERDAMMRQRASETGCAIAYLNRVGGQDELVFDGSSLLIDGDGTLHPPARAFETAWLATDFDGEARRFGPCLWPAESERDASALAYRAIVCGLRDYVHHNGFKDVLLGLSGGVDSALTLALAVDALGAQHVTAVRLPSCYTADLSNDLAAQQAQRLGVRLHTLPIAVAFDGFLDILAPLFADQAPDQTEENLQSRCRGALLMALANKFGGMLITTGNKSEYAVGYATIYGDMCGGYAPLKDLYKTEVYALCRYRNAQVGEGEADVIPQTVIERPPSAELRENQTDQDSLPPYAVLDAILCAWVDQEQSRDEIVAAGFERETVDRIVHLVAISEWKRRQSAPGPKVSRRAFGRERRYPISNAWR